MPCYPPVTCIRPSNDECATATDVAAVPYWDLVDTSVAEPGLPVGSCNSPTATKMNNDVWWRYTPASSCTLTVTIEYSLDLGSNYDGLTAIYTGPDCANLAEIHCLDSGFLTRERTYDSDTITFSATAGTTYWFQVGDWGTEPGGGPTEFVLECY